MANSIVEQIKDQKDFDDLFPCLFHTSRKVRMRAADSIEKISSRRPEFLHAHKKQLVEFLSSSENKEFKWHLAQMVSRVKLTGKEKNKVISILKQWLTDKSESRIVRVNSLQALFDVSKTGREELGQLERVAAEIYMEKSPL